MFPVDPSEEPVCLDVFRAVCPDPVLRVAAKPATRSKSDSAIRNTGALLDVNTIKPALWAPSPSTGTKETVLQQKVSVVMGNGLAYQ